MSECPRASSLTPHQRLYLNRIRRNFLCPMLANLRILITYICIRSSGGREVVIGSDYVVFFQLLRRIIEYS